MTPRFRALGIPALVLALPLSLRGQAKPIELDSASVVRWTRALPRLDSTLRQIDSAELVFRTRHGYFTKRLDSLGISAVAGDESRALLWADSAGWRALATDRGVGNGGCIQSAGDLGPALEPDSLPFGDRCLVNGTVTSISAGSVTPHLVAQTSVVQEKPSERCPPLVLTPEGIRNLHGRSQSLLTQFIVDSTGEPEVGRLLVTGGTTYYAVVMGIESVARCHFRPARIEGHPVRVLVQMPVNLSPPGGRAPKASATDAAAQADVLAPTFTADLRGALRAHARRRWANLIKWLGPQSADDSAQVARWSARGIHLLPLVSDDSGWSAVAWHDSLPGTVCGTSFGSAPPPLDPDAPSGTFVCLGGAGVVQPLEDSVDVGRLWLAGELAPDARPRTLACGQVEGLIDQHGPLQWIRVRVVIDTTGLVRPSPVRVVSAANFVLAREALWMVQACRFAPGRVNGVPVATATEVPVRIGDQ